jgi:hypothetical protein
MNTLLSNAVHCILQGRSRHQRQGRPSWQALSDAHSHSRRTLHSMAARRAGRSSPLNTSSWNISGSRNHPRQSTFTVVSSFKRHTHTLQDGRVASFHRASARKAHPFTCVPTSPPPPLLLLCSTCVDRPLRAAHSVDVAPLCAIETVGSDVLSSAMSR